MCGCDALVKYGSGVRMLEPVMTRMELRGLGFLLLLPLLLQAAPHNPVTEHLSR